MKRAALVALFLVTFAGTAAAHHKQGHQNTEPFINSLPFDCGRMKSFIEAQRDLIRLKLKYHKPIFPIEIEKLKDIESIYGCVCREI